MFRAALLVLLAAMTWLVMPALGQDASNEQKACFDKRADQPADLDGRMAACLAVIGNSLLVPDIRAEAHLRRALAYAQKAEQSNSAEDIDRAIADLSEGLRLDSNNTGAQKYAYLTRAGLYFHKGDHERAIADYTDLIRLEPNSATAYGYRGVVYASKGEHERAISDFSEAIRLDPKAARSYSQRGWSYLQTGKVAEALADADRAVALAPNDAASYSTRVVINRTLGKTDVVIGDLRKALSLDPSNEGIKEELRLAEAPTAPEAENKGAETKQIELVKAELRKAQEAAKAAEQRLAALESAELARRGAPGDGEVVGSVSIREAPINAGQLSEPIRLHYFASWDKNCASRPLPRISINSGPKHGKIDLRSETLPVRRILHGSAKCLGTHQSSRVVYYIPSDSAVTDDHVSLVVHFISGNSARYDCKIITGERSAKCKPSNANNSNSKKVQEAQRTPSRKATLEGPASGNCFNQCIAKRRHPGFCNRRCS
jgi:tetratricopeptide (TPR) repeat protein